MSDHFRKRIRQHRLRAAAFMLACGAVALSGPALGQAPFPGKPIRLIVAVAPGGGADTMGRMSAAKVSERLGVPVVVENITGASGLLGIMTVVKAAPDGYTLCINSSSSYNATMYSGKAGDPRKTLAPVAQLTSQPLVMMVHPSLPVHSMQELIAYGKKNPKGLSFASQGIGTSGHLIGEIINQKTGLKMVHIPYKGTGPGILDVMNGRVEMAFGSPGSAAPHVRAGKLRVVAQSGGRRSAGLPDLPTMAEQGVDVDWMSWFGIFTTFGAPRQNILTLNAAFNQAAASPEMQKLFITDGSDPAPGTPEQFGANVFRILDDGARLIREMGLKLDE